MLSCVIKIDLVWELNSCLLSNYDQPRLIKIHLNYIIQICSGITHGRVLNVELYIQRL